MSWSGPVGSPCGHISRAGCLPGGGRDRTALHRPDHSKLVQVGARSDGVMAAGPPAQVRREIAGSPLEEMLSVQPCAYIELGRRHAAGIEPVSR